MGKEKGLIVDLERFATHTTILMRGFLREEEVPVKSITDIWTNEHSTKFVLALFDDEINRRSKWASDTNNAVAYIATWLTESGVINTQAFSERSIEDIAEKICYTKLDLVVADIESNVIDLIGDDEWMIWDVKIKFGALIVMADIDYRIKVYNEKTGSGEWSP